MPNVASVHRRERLRSMIRVTLDLWGEKRLDADYTDVGDIHCFTSAKRLRKHLRALADLLAEEQGLSDESAERILSVALGVTEAL